MPSFDEVFLLFPSAAYSPRVFFVKMLLLVDEISIEAVEIEFYLAILGIILTIFHLIILTRKPMRTSSIISLMIVIAFCDLISMILAIASKDIIINFAGKDCVPPITLFVFYVYTVMTSLRDDVIRCSTWLSVSLALIRYLVMKRATTKPGEHSKIEKFRFGMYLFGVIFLVSTLFSVLYYVRAKIVQTGDWKPAENCPNVVDTEPVYGSGLSDLFTLNHSIVNRVFSFLNGFLSNILPCIILPILTALLISVLQITDRISRNSNVSALEKNKIERTTGLVIFISITFFIAFLPIGIFSALQAIYTDIGFVYMGSCIRMIGGALLTVNATLHCFICFAMSSQYRTTVKGLLRISKKSAVVRTEAGPPRIGPLVTM